MGYRIDPSAPSTTGPSPAYEHLAALLAEAVRTRTTARTTGRRAGRRLVDERAAAGSAGVDSVEEIRSETERLGFAPVAGADDGTIELVLRRCPFDRVAVLDPATVCGLHLGLVEGMAKGLGGVRVRDLVVGHPPDAGCRVVLERV
jgi:predicted ArsR family transcriptional regulator